MIDEKSFFRWKSPIPIDKWTPRVINGTQPPPACAQSESTINSISTPNLLVNILRVNNLIKDRCIIYDRCLKIVFT